MKATTQKQFLTGFLTTTLASVVVSVNAAPVAEVPANYDRAADKHDFTVFMKDGGWCWYQDPRVIVENGKLVVGGLSGRSGDVRVGCYDLKTDKNLGAVVLHEKFQADDHDAPALFARPDGSVLAVYARHNIDPFHYSRLSAPNNPLKWGQEFKHERTSPSPKDGVTYMNLYEFKTEGLLYNFYRGIDFNPTFVTSTNFGKTWSEPVHFFQNEVGGRQRPYARYAGNGTDSVSVSITDAHPRDFGNSLYYFEFHHGNFYKADGSLIKSLKSDGPLRPSEAELVYKGSQTMAKPAGFESVPNSAWTSSLATDEQGHPHIGYTLYLSNNDHRFRLASWDGAKWIDREVAFAGKCLYTQESSYTGLITLDPKDPTVVFISTDVDPSTGKDRGGNHEIYRAKIGPHDLVSTIKWEPVTKNSPVRNIRPMVLREGNQRIVLWNRGDFPTFLNYDLDTVGFKETVKE